MDPLLPGELSLAPSEEVFLALQGRRSKRDLLSMTLKAALLACEDAGVVRFSIVATPGPRSVLSPHAITVTPTANTVEWPPHSIEDRLRFGDHGAPGDLIYEWLCGDASNPWALGVDKVWIGMTLRGLATVTRRRFNRLAYAAGPLAAAQVAAHSNRLDRLTAAQVDRADFWTLLDREIEGAMARRTISSDHQSDANPWDDEVEADRLRLLGPEHTGPLMILLLATISGGIALFDGFAAWKGGHLALAGASAAVAILLGTVDLLPWPPSVRRVFTAMSRSASFGTANGAAAGTPALRGRIVTLAFLTPFVVLVSLIAAMLGWVGELILAIGVGMGAWRLLKRVSGVAISDRVAQQGVAAMAANGTPAALAPVQRAESPPPARRLRLEVVSPAELPEPSLNAQARFQVVEARGVALRRTYRRLISQLATAYVLIISAAAGWRGRTPFHSKAIMAAWVLWAATMLVLWRRVFVALWRRRAGQDPQETKSVETIQPMAHALAGALWFGVTLLTIPAYVNSAWPVTWLLLASACLYVVQFQRTRSALERRYPVVAPANLLALRVFGSPSLKDFMALTSYWRWMGTTQRLDGPDTTGNKTADVLAVVTGRANERIVKTEQDLAAALAAFREDTDGQLRYTLNSIQCSNATWQQALDRLLGKADVVVMDLSGFSSERLGCKYELGTLVEKVGLDRVLLLVDDSTDLGLLEDVLHEAWAAASPDSANRLADHSVTLVRTGGLSDRQSNESAYAWQRRLQTRLGGKRLVGRMVDMALAATTTSTGVSRIDAVRVVKWPRPWTGGMAGFLHKSILVLVVLVSLLASTCTYLSRTTPDAAKSPADAAR